MGTCEKSIKSIQSIENEEKAKETDFVEVSELATRLGNESDEIVEHLASLESTRAKMVETRLRQRTNLELGMFGYFDNCGQPFDILNPQDDVFLTNSSIFGVFANVANFSLFWCV